MPIWNLFSKGKKKKLEAEVLFQVALQREQAAAQHEQAIEVERQYRLEEAALAKQRLQREEEDYRRQQEFAEQNRRYTRAFPAPLRSMENRARARQELRRQQEEHQHRLTAEQEKELLKQMAREHKIIRGEQAEIKARQGQNSPKQFQYESFTHDNRDTKNIVAEAKSKGGYYNIPANLEVLDPVRSEPQLQMRVRAAEKSDFNSLGSNATRAVATAHFSSRSVPEDVKEPNAEEIYPEENSGTENLENSNTSDGEDSSYSGTSSSPTRNNALLVSQVEEKRQALLDRLMEYFYSTFDPSARGFKSYTGPNSLGNSGASGIGNGANKHSSEATGSHRAVDNDSLSHKGDAGDDSNDGPPRGGKLRKNWSGSVKRLACPYFKHNPRRYQDITSCPGPGWSSVPRLKEHLYRRHASPIHCPRCYQHFEHTMELKDHQRASEGCDVRTKTAIEGFDKEQETRLRSKKRSAVSRSEEDKWREVYIILFPDEDESNIPTPYYDYGSSPEHATKSSDSIGIANYEEYLSRELPRRVRRKLEDELDKELEPVEERLKAQIIEIVKTCQEELFRNYQTRPSTSSKQFTVALPETSGPDNTIADQYGHFPATYLGGLEISNDLAAFSVPPYSDDGLLSARVPIPLQQLDKSNESDSGYRSLQSEQLESPSNCNYNVDAGVDWSNFFSVQDFPTAIPENSMFDTSEPNRINLSEDPVIQDTPICKCPGKGKGRADEHECAAMSDFKDV